MSKPPCNWCDPSFGCFNTPEPCHKAPHAAAVGEELRSIIAEYDSIVDREDRQDPEWDFVMRARDYRALRDALSSRPPTAQEGWVRVPSQANVTWSGRMKGQSNYRDYSNYELQQIINAVLAAAPQEQNAPVRAVEGSEGPMRFEGEDTAGPAAAALDVKIHNTTDKTAFIWDEAYINGLVAECNRLAAEIFSLRAAASLSREEIDMMLEALERVPGTSLPGGSPDMRWHALREKLLKVAK